MCPLRFILVFFSAVLAGYVAWRTVCSSQDAEFNHLFEEDSTSAIPSNKKQEFGFLKMVQNGFWVFVDMASGRYLWRNLQQMRSQEAKTC